MNLLRSASQAHHAATSRTRDGTSTVAAPRRRRDTSAAPNSALVAPRGGASERLGRRFAGHSPILLFCLTTLAGYVILAALMIGFGFLLVDVVLPVHVIGHDDEAVNTWLASHRSSTRNDVSFVGTAIGDIPFIPALVILTAIGAAILRRWRVFAFILGAIAVEVASYRVTSLIVHRQRPSVPRLDPDHLPVNQSYPSGHVAAAVVVYIGLALLISARLRDRGARIAIWTLAIALPLVVALSRMYRGMHHPLDVAAGCLMGFAAISIALFATRAAGEAARLRSSAGSDGSRA
jgi:membrane-associated phospholipid phosphatase